MSAQQREFDIVIFGASGFVGYYAIRDLIQSIDQNPAEYCTLRWAVAGRRLDKIDAALHELSTELGRDLTRISKIEADVSDDKSIASMAERTKLVLNCVGPYREFGRQVVDACVRSGTHHLDLSAELQFIEGTQVDCDKDAQQSEALIISAVGFCSIIAETGIQYLRDNFEGTLHSVETYVDLKPGDKGYKANVGSFHSIMYMLVHILELPPIRRRLYAEILTSKLPKSRISQWQHLMKFPCSSDAAGLSVMFPLPDPQVVARTQHYNYQFHNERPIQYSSYYRLRMWKIIFAWPILFLAWTKCGRAVLERHIDRLSGGFISKNGPSREQVEGARFSMRIIGRGWSERCDDAATEPKGKRDRKMVLKVSGGDPSYLVTACCLVQAGLTILMDRDRMPRGGVLTPGTAFRNTSLTSRLQSRGIQYEILSNHVKNNDSSVQTTVI